MFIVGVGAAAVTAAVGVTPTYRLAWISWAPETKFRLVNIDAISLDRATPVHLCMISPTILRSSNMASKVLLFGTGSIGAVYAYIVSKAVSPGSVVCVCRSNFPEAQENGFSIDSTIFGNVINFKPRIVRHVEDAVSLGPYDVGSRHYSMLLRWHKF